MSNPWDDARSETRRRLRSAITEAAVGLLETQGLGSISMKDLASRAGVSRQTLYKHFSSVEAALVAYLLDEIDAVQRATIKLMGSIEDPIARLELFMDRAIKRATGRDIQLAVQTVMSPEGETTIREAVSRIQDHLRSTIEDGIRLGSMRTDLEPEIAASLIFGIIETAAQLVGHGAEPERVAAQTMGMVRQAVVA